MRARRFSSRMASVFTSSGMPAASSFCAQLFHVAAGVVAFAQLLLDGLQLLAQIELALALRKLALHLRLNAAAQFQQFQLAREVAVDLVRRARAVGLLEQLLPLGRAQRGQVAGDEIGQRARLGDAASAVDDRSSERLGEAATICWNRLSTFCRSASTSGVISGSISGMRSMRRLQERLGGGEFDGADARDAFAEQQQVVLGHADGLVHHAHRAHLVQIVRARACRRADRAGR